MSIIKQYVRVCCALAHFLNSASASSCLQSFVHTKNNEISTTIPPVVIKLGQCPYLIHMHYTKFEDLVQERISNRPTTLTKSKYLGVLYATLESQCCIQRLELMNYDK